MNDKEATPAEPEVLWRVPPGTTGGWYAFKILADGSAWSCHPLGGNWIKMDGDRMHPAIRELARRLLTERAEQERLDDHNDEMEASQPLWVVEAEHLEERLRRVEAIADPVALAILRGQSGLHSDPLNTLEAKMATLGHRVEELDKNLAREVERRALETKEQHRNCAVYERVQADLIAAVEGLRAALSRPSPAAAPEAPPALRWERGANRMINSDGVEVLDLGDCDNLRPEEHAWLSRLADLWCAWGDHGYLRERLVNASGRGNATTKGWWQDHPDFRQLRSELLAVPWLFERKEGI